MNAYEAYQNVVKFWYLACGFEGISTDLPSAQFSLTNPYKQEYENAVRLWLALVKGKP